MAPTLCARHLPTEGPKDCADAAHAHTPAATSLKGRNGLCACCRHQQAEWERHPCAQPCCSRARSLSNPCNKNPSLHLGVSLGHFDSYRHHHTVPACHVPHMSASRTWQRDTGVVNLPHPQDSTQANALAAQKRSRNHSCATHIDWTWLCCQACPQASTAPCPS